MFPKTYFLVQNYYEDVYQATNEIIQHNDKYTKIIDDYLEYINEYKIEPPRTKEEYLIELLMLGTFWRNYIVNAAMLTKSKAQLLINLYQIREKQKKYKLYIDKLRGILNTRFLLKENYTNINASYHNFQKLITWLSATIEFKEEAKRFYNWEKYGREISNLKFTQIIYSAIDLSFDMEKISSNYLKSYLGNTAYFLENQSSQYNNKENIIFTGKKTNEYYLNMICAEILNRVYQSKFAKTRKKIVLLPKCMSKGPDCKASKSASGFVCTKCRSQCNIQDIVLLGEQHNFEVRLISHSSEFSQWLQTWKNQEYTGVVGVSCLLNLVKGGFEMRRLNIPSQCVLLNYSSCQNHWGGGNPTSINISQLLKIIK